jgi:hypothetical protein
MAHLCEKPPSDGLTSADIRGAINRARRGIEQYQELMGTVHSVDVSQDATFQRKYNAFYRVRSRSSSWYVCYYGLMEGLKLERADAEFAHVLDEIHATTGRYEPSFASKLVATLDPSKPIWDAYVLANSGHKRPLYSNKEKMALAKGVYQSIEHWYARFLASEDGKRCIHEFDSLVENRAGITDLKKVDFILWQMR